MSSKLCILKNLAVYANFLPDPLRSIIVKNIFHGFLVNMIEYKIVVMPSYCGISLKKIESGSLMSILYEAKFKKNECSRTRTINWDEGKYC